MDVETNQIAAVDLGSNSFHMVVAKDDDGRPQMLDRIRERVSLATGLDRDGPLVENARRRALSCLARFSERRRELPAVRGGGTLADLRRRRPCPSYEGRPGRQVPRGDASFRAA